MIKKSNITKQQKKEICRILKLNSRQEKYKTSDIKTDMPQKGIHCYIITLFDDTICINYGKYEKGKFYTAHFSSAEGIGINDTDYKQSIFYKEIIPDAYIPFK